MGLDMPKPLSILVDNAAAIAFSKGQVRRSKLKQIDVRQEWVQAVRDEQICQMDKVDTVAGCGINHVWRTFGQID